MLNPPAGPWPVSERKIIVREAETVQGADTDVLTKEQTAMNDRGKETSHHRICPFCEACCGLELTLVEGKVQKVRGHQADVFSGGYLCPKGVALKDLHEDPDRLRTPLIKRDGRFAPATWAEAFAEIESRLPAIMERGGRDAVALALGNPIVHKAG